MAAISVRDLPVEIKKSQIHGKGVFSKEKIKKGDVVGLIMKKLKGAKDTDSAYSRTDIGKYLNHSKDPNALAISTKKGYALAASRDIPANTEILVDYEEFQELSGIPQRIPLSKRAAEYVEKKKEESGNITYIYTEKHVKERDEKKAKKLDKLSKNITKVRKEVGKDLKSSDIKTKYNALAVALIDDTYERVGNRYSAEDMKHYGVTTWLKKHIKFTGGTAVIKYTGKSGVEQDKKITNKSIIPVLREMVSGKKDNDTIFKGDNYYITDNTVNAYLKPFDITAKDIRGFHANEEMRKELKKVRKGSLPKEQKEKEKKLKEEFKEALENTAKIVGHEAGTLKNQYLVPGLETSYTTKGKVASQSFPISKRAIKWFEPYETQQPGQWKSYKLPPGAGTPLKPIPEEEMWEMHKKREAPPEEPVAPEVPKEESPEPVEEEAPVWYLLAAFGHGLGRFRELDHADDAAVGLTEDFADGDPDSVLFQLVSDRLTNIWPQIKNSAVKAELINFLNANMQQVYIDEREYFAQAVMIISEVSEPGFEPPPYAIYEKNERPSGDPMDLDNRAFAGMGRNYPEEDFLYKVPEEAGTVIGMSAESAARSMDGLIRWAEQRAGAKADQPASDVKLSKRAALAEEEVQRLLLRILPGTPFAGKAFSVGGYERDKLMGMESKDLDIVVEMRGGAEALCKFIADSFPEQTSTPRQLGAAYPIWHVAFKDDITYEGQRYATTGAEIDIADTQKEHYPDPSSRQRETVYAPLKDDIERRDFTVNMLLRDLTSGEIEDLTGTSKEDIEKGILRGHPAVNPDTMFSNDPLRMLRLIRFQCKYDWKIPMFMLRSVRRNAEEIQKISWERIQEELTKVMKLGKTAQAIKIMKATNLLPLVLPEIYGLIGVKHDKRSHQEGDVYKHTLLVLSNAPPTIHGQLAALLHDIGKPETQEFIGDKIQFMGHEKAGAEIAEAILRRLKFDGKTIQRVKSMVENHMRPHSLEKASPKALRKFVRDVGEGMVDDVLDLAEADALGNMPPSNYIPELRKRIEQTKEIPVARKPILNGKEIMEILDVKPGPIIGQVGKYLLELQDGLAEEGKELTKDVAKRMVMEKFAGGGGGIPLSKRAGEDDVYEREFRLLIPPSKIEGWDVQADDYSETGYPRYTLELSTSFPDIPTHYEEEFMPKVAYGWFLLTIKLRSKVLEPDAPIREGDYRLELHWPSKLGDMELDAIEDGPTMIFAKEGSYSELDGVLRKLLPVISKIGALSKKMKSEGSFAISKRAAVPTMLYHYGPSGVDLIKEGLKTPASLSHMPEVLEKYRGRAAEELGKEAESLTTEEIIEALEKLRGPGGSRVVSLLLRPIGPQDDPEQQAFAKRRKLYAVDYSRALADGLIEGVSIVEEKPRSQREVEQGSLLEELSKAKGFKRTSPRLLFQGTPHAFVTIKSGTLPGEYLEEISDGFQLSRRAAKVIEFPTEKVTPPEEKGEEAEVFPLEYPQDYEEQQKRGLTEKQLIDLHEFEKRDAR